MHEIPNHLWNTELTGCNLRGRVLAEELGEQPVLLVFLRHLG